MRPIYILGLSVLLSIGGFFAVAALIHGHTIPVFEPKGLIASKELNLLISTTLLTLIVIVPILILTAFFGWWYRASNKKARYAPDEEHGLLAELVWWAIPFEIILVIGFLTWSSTHDLDPHKKLAVGGEPLHVQVVALEWKWLFIYPEQGIATVNVLNLPVGRPVEFSITADAPMNSFWIPQLGGQIYAMTGMTTKLHLIADHPGTFSGGSANYSGIGFAQMKFPVFSQSQDSFDEWIGLVKNSSNVLDANEYAELAEPKVADEPLYYGAVDSELYNMILMQYQSPTDSNTHGT